MSDGGATPAGWFPDPEGTRAWRWWNGEAWDQRTTPYPGPGRPLAVPASWLTWLAVLAPGVSVLAGALIQRSYAAASGPLEAAASSGAIRWTPAVTTVVVAALVGLVGELAVVAWLLRFGQLARDLGYRLSTSPALGAWTWLVPLVKLLLPYRLLADLSPLGHPRRARVRASWLGLLAYQLASLAVGLGSATPSGAAIVVVTALGLGWWVTFAPLVLATSSGLAEAALAERGATGSPVRVGRRRP